MVTSLWKNSYDTQPPQTGSHGMLHEVKKATATLMYSGINKFIE